MMDAEMKIENIEEVLAAYDNEQYEDDYEVLSIIRLIIEEGNRVIVDED